jgi:competence protein ComGC
MGGTALVNRFKNNKGQTVVEAIVIIHIMLILFLAMLLIASYIYNKMVVMYAANSAVSKALEQAPNTGMTLKKLESIMKGQADDILRNGIFLVNPGSTARARVTRNGIATFSVTSSGRQGLRLPLLDYLLDNQLISYTVEYDYYDPNF